MATTHFVNVSEEGINFMKNNTISRNTKTFHKVENDTLQM